MINPNRSGLYFGDCLDIMKDIPDNSIDLIATDPPYKVTSRGSSGDTGGMLTGKVNMDGKVFKHNSIKIEDWIGEVYRVLKESSHCYIMTNQKNLQNYLNVISKSGLKIFRTLIWNKGNKITNMFYMSQVEFIIFCRKGKAKRINDCGTSELLNIPNKKTKDSEGKNIHDTEKPVELMKILIENSTKPKDMVFDPFMGSGSTCVAARLAGRKCIGIEKDDKYFKIAIKRIKGEKL